MEHMYITNNVEVARIAEKYGVERIWIDLETLGKDMRQFSYDSLKSNHSVNDIYIMKNALRDAKVLARVNPWHKYPYGGYKDSQDEVEAVIHAGADYIMLPMWKSVEEVMEFVGAVGHRSICVLLLETKEAEACLEELIELRRNGKCLFDEIHIGLNDLHISYGLDFMFELLINGCVERICEKLRGSGISYGIGGIAKVGDGAIPAEKILPEYCRLGSERVILSRTFCDNAIIDDITEIDRVFKYNMKRLRDFEAYAGNMSKDEYEHNRKELVTEIGLVASSFRKKKINKKNRLNEKIDIIWNDSIKNSVRDEAFYLLDKERFEQNYIDLKRSFSSIYKNVNLAYSCKTNYIPNLLRHVDTLGGYIEVVSEMELELALQCGISENKIIWNGPIKKIDTVLQLLKMGGEVNVDTLEELQSIADRFPESNQTAEIGIRCNFDIGDGNVSRFGIDTESKVFLDAIYVFKKHRNIKLKAVCCHFASRQIDYWPARVSKMIEITRLIRNELGIQVERVDFGGGLYGKMPECLSEQFTHKIPSYSDYAECMSALCDEYPDYGIELILEPGTAIVADSMYYFSRVESVKSVRGKQFITVNGSQKNINMVGVNPPIKIYNMDADFNPVHVENSDITGYTCIEGDVLYKGFSGDISVGDYVAFGNCGSYSVVMKPPFIRENCPIYEIQDDLSLACIKRTETADDIFRTYTIK